MYLPTFTPSSLNLYVPSSTQPVGRCRSSAFLLAFVLLLLLMFFRGGRTLEVEEVLEDVDFQASFNLGEDTTSDTSTSTSTTFVGVELSISSSGDAFALNSDTGGVRSDLGDSMGLRSNFEFGFGVASNCCGLILIGDCIGLINFFLSDVVVTCLDSGDGEGDSGGDGDLKSTSTLFTSTFLF